MRAEREERGPAVAGAGRLAAYRKQQPRPDLDYRHARIYPGQPIRKHQCRNPGRAGKCHPGRREAAGPFKDWMPSFHFSVSKFSAAPPNYFVIYLGPATLLPLAWIPPPPFPLFAFERQIERGVPRTGPRNSPLVSLASCFLHAAIAATIRSPDGADCTAQPPSPAAAG